MSSARRVNCHDCCECIADGVPGPLGEYFIGMIVCVICGNKRCPHATDHHNACTGSNEPNQPGSRYGGLGAPKETLMQRSRSTTVHTLTVQGPTVPASEVRDWLGGKEGNVRVEQQNSGRPGEMTVTTFTLTVEHEA